MADFLYLYRIPSADAADTASPQEMQARLERWQAWFGVLQAEGHVKNMGHPLEARGGQVRAGAQSVTDGPFPESKDLILGYSIIEAPTLEKAMKLAEGCPIIKTGGTVEVRPIRQM
jgi:hypothetical protein